MGNYYCEYCGYKADDARVLVMLNCHRHPAGPMKGRHKLYEGTEKSVYTCKYCGFRARSIKTLTSLNCFRHPAGSMKGKHSPAL